jgi:hypothetical protein
VSEQSKIPFEKTKQLVQEYLTHANPPSFVVVMLDED